MGKVKISIRRSSFFILLATASFTMFSISALWVMTEVLKSKRKLHEITESYETEQRIILKREVKKVASLINYSRKYNTEKTTVELQNEILDYVSSIRLRHGGYIFINTYGGRALIFDGVKIIGEKDITNLTDPDGLKLFDVELDLAGSHDGGYFHYKFKRLDTFKPVPKLSYVIGYNDWEWIIGAGIYLDDLNLIIQDSKNQYQAILFKKVLYIVILFIVLLFLLIGVSMVLHGYIKNEFNVFMSFFNKPLDENSIIERNKLQVEEFKELAHSANVMIKQRRVAEKLLKQERDRAHKYLNVADVIILALDTWGVVTLINNKGCETLGYDEKYIVGKNWFSNFVPLADKQNLASRFSKIMTSENKIEFDNGENNIITRSGQERLISWQNTLLIDDNGNITGSLSSGQDITERRNVEASYFESEEKYKLLFEKTSDPVLLIGRHDTFIDCNDAAVTILGLKNKEELIGTHPDDLSPVKQPDGGLSITKAGKMIEKARREGFNRFEWLHINKNKEPFFVDVSLTSIPISGVEYLYVVWRDISEKKEQDKELIIAKEKAEQSDNIKTSFLHNMQHEIRTPLNAMMGFSQLLKNNGLDHEEAEEYFEAIINSGNQLNKIIDEIIDFSKLQSGFILINNQNTELKNLLVNIFKEHYPIIHSKPVKFTINVCPSEEISVINTDVQRLLQIVGNLIDNAFKFTEKGTVELGYKISDNDITFYVTDTGVGIEEKYFSSIFDKFSRLTHNSSEKLYGGNGLGLSISKSVLDFLGGKIWVESEINRGSKFSFTIPYRPLSISEEFKNECLDGNNITIVTSKKANFNLLSKVLENTGVNLIHIKKSVEAIEFCQNNYKTDLMIMDINLSGMNGITTTKAIKAFNKELPIVALITNGDENITKEDALVAGCDDYICLSQTETVIKLTLSLYLKTDILTQLEEIS